MNDKHIPVGIDNGTTGAVVALNPDGNVIDLFDTPVLAVTKTRFSLNIPAMFGQLLRMIQSDAIRNQKLPITVYAEKAQPMPAKFGGSIASFHRGQSAAAWQMACAALGLPVVFIRPQAWQKLFLKGVQGKDTKAKALMKASQIWPTLPLIKKGGRIATLHGRADAALIALFGLRLVRTVVSDFETSG